MTYNLIMTVIIFVAKLIEISLSSIRLIFTVKQEKLKAATIGFIEVLIWAFIVSKIITSLSENPFWLFSYCFGYASGIYMGSIIENKLSIGNRSVQFIISLKDKAAILEYLSNNGNGYTIINAEGSTETKLIILTIVKRKELSKIIKEVENICNEQVFSIVSDVNNVIGGIGLRK